MFFLNARISPASGGLNGILPRHKRIKRPDFPNYIRLTTTECEDGASASRLEQAAMVPVVPAMVPGLNALLSEAVLQVAMEHRFLPSVSV